MAGTLAVLNVGEGDEKFIFDKDDPVSTIKAARIVRDMLRRGYALLVPTGDGKYVRVHEFDPDKCEYLIADLDPEAAQDRGEDRHGAQIEAGDGGRDEEGARQAAGEGATGRRGRGFKRVSAHTTDAVAVGRTAGG